MGNTRAMCRCLALRSESAADGPQEDLLSEDGIKEVSAHINASINIWLVGEGTEQEAIEFCVRAVNHRLKECLQSFLDDDYNSVVTLLLDDSAPVEDKTALLQDVVARNLREPLVERLNSIINVPFVSEDAEEKMLRTICDGIFDAIVAAVVRNMAIVMGAINSCEDGERKLVVEEPPAMDDAVAEAAALQEDLLSERLLQETVDRINKSIDIWLVGEERERDAIEAVVRAVNPALKGVLGDLVRGPWKNAVEIMLNDELSVEAMTDTMTGILGGSVGDPMARALNGQINIPLVCHEREQEMFETVTDGIVKGIVGRTVAWICRLSA